MNLFIEELEGMKATLCEERFQEELSLSKILESLEEHNKYLDRAQELWRNANSALTVGDLTDEMKYTLRTIRERYTKRIDHCENSIIWDTEELERQTKIIREYDKRIVSIDGIIERLKS